jgi:RNA polymerase sigma-70 factor (ECF subfamily)
VYREEFSYVYRTLRHLGARPSDVEDLAHDVFVVVHQRLADYDPARPIRPWLFGIAFRVAMRHRGRLSTRSEVPTAEPPEEEQGARRAEERVAAREAWRLVLCALDEIELDQRGVLVMHDLEGHPAPDIAEAFGVPLNTVYSRLRLARGKFAAAVKRLKLDGGRP